MFVVRKNLAVSTLSAGNVAIITGNAILKEAQNDPLLPETRSISGTSPTRPVPILVFIKTRNYDNLVVMGTEIEKITADNIYESTSNARELFLEGIRSKETKYRYTITLKRFLCGALAEYLKGDPKKVEAQREERMKPVIVYDGKRNRKKPSKQLMNKILDADFDERCTQFVALCKADPDTAINIILTYQRGLKERVSADDENKLSAGYVKNLIKPIRKLCYMNGVDKKMAWERVVGASPEGEQNDYRAYTKYEIQKFILPYIDSDRNRAVVFIALSSGMRSGGFDFTWNCIKPVYRKDGKLELGEYTDSDENVVCIIFDIYKGTKDRYIAFGTPEAWVHIKWYMKSWKNDTKDYPKPDHYFIKSELHKDRQLMGDVTPTSAHTVGRSIYKIFDNEYFNISDGISKRREIPVLNGFRYFFNEHNKEAFSKDTLASLIKKEYMMSHTGLIKLDENYFRKNWKVLVEEYEYAIPHLTIDDNADLKVKLSKTEQELERLKNVEIKVEKMQHDMEAMEQVRETMDKE